MTKNHCFTRETHKNEIDGNMSFVVSKCSCGWQSSKKYFYDDFMYSSIEQQEKQHLFDIEQRIELI